MAMDDFEKSVFRELMALEGKALAGSTSTTMSTAPAGVGKAITAEDLLASMSKVMESVPSGALPTSTTVSAAPSWATTTLKWLRENGHGHYITGRGSDAAKTLAGALRRMSYGRVEMDKAGTTREDYEAAMDRAARGWDMRLHKHLVHWIESGGYAAEKEAASAMHEPDDADKEIVLEPDPTEAPIKREAVPPAVDEDLGETVAALQRQADPRNGSW